jgi:small conductance mechanosensitive channel
MDESFSLNPEIPSQLTGQGAPAEPVSITDLLSIDYISQYIEWTFEINLFELINTVITIIIILAATIFTARLIDRMLKKSLPRVLEVGGVKREVDETINSITRRMLVAAVYLLGFLLIILQVPSLHRVAVAMLAGAGIATIAISFAAQDSLSNIISGIFLAVFKPFRIGDYIDFQGSYGQIEDLTLRHTVIRTWDLRRIVVPNSSMGKENIINWTLGDAEVIWPVNIGIAYTADIDLAKSIIVEETRKHPHVLKNEEINVRVTELGDFAVNLRLTFHVPNRDLAWDTGCDIREAIKKHFDQDGVEIPYPYQNVILKRQEIDSSGDCECKEGSETQEYCSE